MPLRKYCEASEDGTDGVVVQIQTKIFLWWLNHHPVRSFNGCFALFLDVAATPPGQEGSSARSVPLSLFNYLFCLMNASTWSETVLSTLPKENTSDM